MKNEKNYMGFLITKIWQILKRSSRALSWAQTSYFWRVRYNLGLPNNFLWTRKLELGLDRQACPKNTRDRFFFYSDSSHGNSVLTVHKKKLRFWAISQKKTHTNTLNQLLLFINETNLDAPGTRCKTRYICILGIQIRNMKIVFNIYGTWRRVMFEKLIMKIYDFFIRLSHLVTLYNIV